MKKFMTIFGIEYKQGLRGMDTIIFGIAMPVGVLVLIALIAGDKVVGKGAYTFLQSAFASLLAVGICASAFMGIPLTIADYRDKKILKHFFATPCRPGILLGAVFACGAVNSIISAIAVSLVAVVAFGYKMLGDALLFIGVWVLTLVSMYSIGFMIASVCRNIKTANVVTSLVYFPMLFLSGATIPFEIFPKGLQNVASVLPLTQGIKLMKEVSLGYSVENIVGKIVFLMAIIVICTFISVRTFKWE